MKQLHEAMCLLQYHILSTTISTAWNLINNEGTDQEIAALSIKSLYTDVVIHA